MSDKVCTCEGGHLNWECQIHSIKRNPPERDPGEQTGVCPFCSSKEIRYDRGDYKCTDFYECSDCGRTFPDPVAAPSDTKRGEWQMASAQLPADDVTVLVAGGVAQYRSGVWYTGMEEPLFRRPIEWPVTYWMPLPTPETTSVAALPRNDGAPDGGLDTYDYVRLVEWMKDPPEPANTAFTAGALRDAARAFEDAIPAFTARVLKIYEDAAPTGNEGEKDLTVDETMLLKTIVWMNPSDTAAGINLTKSAEKLTKALIERACTPEEG